MGGSDWSDGTAISWVLEARDDSGSGHIVGRGRW